MGPRGRRWGSRHGGGTSPPSFSCSDGREQTSGGAPSHCSEVQPGLPGVGAAEGGRLRGLRDQSSHGQRGDALGSDWGETPVCLRLEQKPPYPPTHPPFRLKLYIFHFKFCNITSSLVLLSFALLVFFSLVLNIYLYYLFLAFFFSFLTLQNERQNDGRLTIDRIIFLFSNSNRCLLNRGWIFFVLL